MSAQKEESMAQQFVYEIDNIEFVVPEGMTCEIAPLTNVQLVATALSDSIGSLQLAIRFRTHCDAKFTEQDLCPPRIKRRYYPDGYDPKDPVKLIARRMRLRLNPDGNYVIKCGGCRAEGVICSVNGLDDYLSVTIAPKEQEKKVYTRDDVDDDEICIPPV